MTRPKFTLPALAVMCIALCAAGTGKTLAQQPHVNGKLERDISSSSPRALRDFPAHGFKDGVAGVMRRAQLRVIPGSVQAWCVATGAGNLAKGCYIEFTYTKAKYLKPHLWETDTNCGLDARWYSPTGAMTRYSPQTGGAVWLSKGNLSALSYVVDDNWKSCQS